MNSENIKEYRKRNLLTQGELASIVKTSIRAVQSWEQGYRNIPQSAISLMENYENTRGGIVSGDNNKIKTTTNNFENVGGDVINQTGDGNVNVYKGSSIKQDEADEKYDESNADVITILKKQIDIQNKQLKEKDEQIAQKDEQINKLINLLNKN